MTSGIVTVFCFTAVFVFVPTSARAWWNMGHMQIAARAFERLEPSAKKEVARLLRLNPDYGAWTDGVPEDQKDRTAFIRASTWPDDIKLRKDFVPDGTRPTDPHAADNIGYKDNLVHAYWHFYNTPFSPDGTRLEKPEDPNALTEILRFASTLKSTAPDDVKSYDLVWLIHLVGDAHQPLHAATRFTRDALGGDNGGNTEKVCVIQKCDETLHMFWDGLLGERGSVQDAISAAARLPSPDAKLAAIGDPKLWLDESFQLAAKHAYPQTPGGKAGPFELDETYRKQALEIARNQAALAAARLANLLNEAFRPAG